MAHLIFEKMNDVDFLIQSLVDIVKRQFQSKDVEYCINYLYVVQLIFQMLEDNKVMAKHKSCCQKELHAERKKER